MTEDGRELGLGLQTDKSPGDYGPLARMAEDAGFDVVTTFNDLWFQPALPALLEIASGDDARASRAVVSQPVHGSSRSRSRARPRRSTRRRTGALSSGSRAGPGWSRSVWISRIRSPRSARRGRSCVACSAGDDSGFTGRRFSLPQGQRLRFPILRDEVPLLVGTWAPRLAAFAGEEAQRAEGRRQRESGRRAGDARADRRTPTSASCSVR